MRRSQATLIALALLLVACSHGPEPPAPPAPAEVEASLARAAERYAAGDYAAAAEAYGWLDATGLRDPALQANLASACLASGDLGCSLLAAHRAARLAPRDARIAAILDAAESRLPDPPPEGLDWLRRAISFDELIGLGLALWFLLGLALLLCRHRPGRTARLLRRASVLLLGLCLLLLAGRWTEHRLRPAAILTARQETPLTAAPGPAEASTSGTALAPGSRLRILETREGYQRVRVFGHGAEGWLPSARVERIDIP